MANAEHFALLRQGMEEWHLSKHALNSDWIETEVEVALVGQLPSKHQKGSGGDRIEERKKEHVNASPSETSPACLAQAGRARIAAHRQGQ